MRTSIPTTIQGDLSTLPTPFPRKPAEVNFPYHGDGGCDSSSTNQFAALDCFVNALRVPFHITAPGIKVAYTCGTGPAALLSWSAARVRDARLLAVGPGANCSRWVGHDDRVGGVFVTEGTRGPNVGGGFTRVIRHPQSTGGPPWTTVIVRVNL